MGVHVWVNVRLSFKFVQRHEDHNEALDSTLCPAKRRRGRAEGEKRGWQEYSEPYCDKASHADSTS